MSPSDSASLSNDHHERPILFAHVDSMFLSPRCRSAALSAVATGHIPTLAMA